MYKVTIEIGDNQIRGLLCAAFEGGSNYWYSNAQPILAEGVVLSDAAKGGRLQPAGNYYHWTQLLPTISRLQGPDSLTTTFTSSTRRRFNAGLR